MSELVPVLTPRLCRVARAMLNWTYDDAKRFSGFDRCRVYRFEAGQSIREADVVAATLRELFESCRSSLSRRQNKLPHGMDARAH